MQLLEISVQILTLLSIVSTCIVGVIKVSAWAGENRAILKQVVAWQEKHDKEDSERFSALTRDVATLRERIRGDFHES